MSSENLEKKYPWLLDGNISDDLLNVAISNIFADFIEDNNRNWHPKIMKILLWRRYSMLISRITSQGGLNEENKKTHRLFLAARLKNFPEELLDEVDKQFILETTIEKLTT